MVKTTEFPAEMVLHVNQEIDIQAPLAVVFESLLEQLGPGGDLPNGAPMPMKLEAWPGGRWFRDLGNNAGHFWGHVQVIKPPTLLEITGPMFMSYPVASHFQYRLTEQGRGTRLSLLHRAMGLIAPEHREGVTRGYAHIISRIKARSEK
ncbi:MAG: SRPBCC domain-containing protein [Planctomycetota bacterium]|nr:SRPBCC domain-containing protein [Planctomycetota bacterium]